MEKIALGANFGIAITERVVLDLSVAGRRHGNLLDDERLAELADNRRLHGLGHLNSCCLDKAAGIKFCTSGDSRTRAGLRGRRQRSPAKLRRRDLHTGRS